MNIFDPQQHFQTITIVGVGGTGAQVARLMARVIYDMRRARIATPRMVLIDPDVVEEKNVGRQLFTAADAAARTPKAEAVGKRLNMALGLDIAWYVEPYEEVKHRVLGEITISCVDNHLARREIDKANGVLIGTGNYRDGGQVVIGNTSDIELFKRSWPKGKDGVYRYLPNESLLFPALLEPDPQPVTPMPELSCADLVLRGEQDVLINDWMALVAAQYATALLRRQPITTFATFINSTSMSVRSISISREEIEAYLG